MTKVIVESKIKEVVPEMSVSAEVYDALNSKVIKLLEEAAGRAKLNGRRTVQARDL